MNRSRQSNVRERLKGKIPNGQRRGFERKVDEQGRPNPRYVDALKVDPPIAGQQFWCASFVSPENILKQKNIFYFEEFLKTWELNKSMEKFIQFLNFLSYKYNLNFEDVTTDFKEFVKEEQASLRNSSMEDDYKNFLDKHEEDLQKRFNIQVNFQTNVRGVINRGNFATQEEAELRAKLLREIDDSLDIHVGPVGMFVPWDPEAYKTGRTEYLEEELNQLMHEKNKNEQNAKIAFEQRVKDTKQQAIDENIRKAEKTGNVLTQSLDENGNLVGVNQAQYGFGTGDPETISTADLCKELFEGDNIVVGKSDNGASLLKSGPFSTRG